MSSYLERCIEEEIMPWGKHKGENFCDVPREYLEWCCREWDNEELVEALQLELDMRADDNGWRG